MLYVMEDIKQESGHAMHYWYQEPVVVTMGHH